jgi:hypothetical protein
MSLGEKRQQPNSHHFNHSAFLLTVAQKPGKTPEIQGLCPPNPHFTAEIQF